MPRPAKMYPANSPAYVPLPVHCPDRPPRTFSRSPCAPSRPAAAPHRPRPFLPSTLPFSTSCAPHCPSGFSLASPRRVSGFPFVTRPAHHAFSCPASPLCTRTLRPAPCIFTMHPAPAPCAHSARPFSYHILPMRNPPGGCIWKNKMIK